MPRNVPLPTQVRTMPTLCGRQLGYEQLPCVIHKLLRHIHCFFGSWYNIVRLTNASLSQMCKRDGKLLGKKVRSSHMQFPDPAHWDFMGRVARYITGSHLNSNLR